MTRGRLVVHGHFYQPSRIDPFSGTVPADPTAAPAHDWTARVDADCYRPNAERGNLARMSWDLGPTLAAWLEAHDPVAYRGFVAGDGGVNGLAQSYHHSILPLASSADRRTEIRWGLRDFARRMGRPATGAWLPETAVDIPTLEALADEGITHTILAPWQVQETALDTRRPYRLALPDGRHLVVALYDGALSAAVSFHPEATSDADRFLSDQVRHRIDADHLPDDERPLVVIATDGELYGHHQPFRELFLERLLASASPDGSEEHAEVVTLASAVAEDPARPFRRATVRERTSWSCHHGVARWSGPCGCAPDGRWKAPLRTALDRLAGGIDAATERLVGGLPGHPDLWALRDRYVDVVIGAEDEEAFAATALGRGASADDRRILMYVLDAQRWRLAMFASDGWFWDDPVRPETASILRAAAKAARTVDRIAGTGAERRLVADLAAVRSPGYGIDGAEIYHQALEAVGQPGPA